MSPSTPSTPSHSSKSRRMGSLLAITGVAGLAMLGSTLAPQADAAITFGNAHDTPGSIILGGLSSMVPKPKSMMDQYLVPGLVNLTKVGLAVNSSTRVIVTAAASLMNPFGPMNMPLGQVGLSVWLDGISLANISTSDLTLMAGIAPINVTATIDVADGAANPALQTSINNLATSLLGGVTPSGPPAKLEVGGITIAGNPLGMANVVIPTQLTPAGPTQAAIQNTTSGPPPVVGLGGLIDTTKNLTWPTLNKVILKAVTGAQITAGVGFSWDNPLNVELDIPYISVDIGFNGTRVLTVGVQSIHLAPGPMTAETLVDLKFNNDPEASVQVGAFVRDFMAGTLNQVLNIGNITFGVPGDGNPTGTLLNTLLSGLEVNLPLMGVSTLAIQDLVLSFIKPYVPIDISQIGGAGGASSLLSYIQGLAISTAPGHTLLISPKILLPFPFTLDLNIPYFSLDINLDNAMLGQLFLANLVGSGQGQIEVSVGIGLAFTEPSPTIPGSVAKLVTGLTTGSSLDILAGVSNLAIGVSPVDAVNTLNHLNIAVPISSVIKGSINTGDLLSGVLAQTNITLAQNTINVKIGSMAELTLHEAAISVLPGNLVKATLNLDVFLGLPVVANIGYLGIALSLDGAPLVGATLNTGLNYGGGKVQMNADVALAIGTGEAIATNVANLVNAVIAGQPVSSSVGIAGIVLGNSPDDLINALSGISLSLPLGGLLGGNAPSLPAGFLDGILAQLGLAVTDLSLATVPNAGLRVGAKAAFSNPIPLSLSVPFIGLSGGLDRIDLLDVGVADLALAPGANALQAAVNLNFNNAPEAQAKVGNFVGEILGGQIGNTPEAITVHNLRIGVSPTDSFDLLSKIDIAIPSKDILNQANIDLIVGKLGLNGTDLAGNLLKGMSISAVSADLNQPPVIELGASVAISNFSINAAVDIGYVGIDLALDVHSLAHVDVPSIVITTANNQLSLTVLVKVAIQDTDEIQTDVAQLVNYFINNGTSSPVTNLVIAKPLLGVSAEDHIQTFSQIKYPLALAPLLAQAKTYINQLLAGAGSSQDLLNRIGISELAIDLNSPQVIGIDASILLKNLAMPADIKLNYVGANIALGEAPLAQIAVPQLLIAPQGADLSIKVHVDVALLSSPQLSKTISGVIGAVLGNQTLPRTDVVLSGAAFGGSPTNTFGLLQKVVVAVDIAPYIGKIGGMLGGAGSLLNGLGLSGLAIDLNNAPVIGIDANIAIRNLTLPAKLNVGYVGVNVAINKVPLVEVSIPRLELGSSGGDLTIGTHVDVALQETDASQTLVAGLVNAIVAGQTPQGTILISGIAFGPNKGNVYTILQDVEIPIPLAKIFGLIPTVPGNASSILDKLELQSADINMKNPPSIGADVAIALVGYQFDAKLMLAYASVSAYLDSTPLAKVNVPGINLSSGNNRIQLGVNALVDLASGGEIQTKVADIVNSIIGNGGGAAGNLVVSKVEFGGGPGKTFHILDKVQVSVALAPYIQKIKDMLGGTGPAPAPGSLPAISVTKLDISAPSANELSIAVGASIGGIGSKISAEMPYVGLNVAAGGQGLVNPSINNLKLANGNLALTLDLPFQPAAKQVVASLSTPVSQLLFTTVGTVPGSIVADNIKFGASPSQAFDIAAKVKVEIQLNTVFQKAQAYINAHNPLHINDMNTVLTTTGISATLVLPGIPLGDLPLKLNFPITVSGYHQGNAILAVKVTSMALGSSPWKLGADITVVQPAFSKAMDSILPNALQWKNALQDVTLGGVALGPFTALGGLTITPPEVTLWSPIEVPLNKLKVHLIPLGMDFTAQFVNRGPLQVDVGTISITVMNGKTVDVLQISSLGGPIHINNGLQAGGQNALSLNASLKFNILELFGIIASLFNPSNFKFVFSMKTSSGQPMPWLQEALNNAPAALFNNLLPILAKALSNVKFTIF